MREIRLGEINYVPQGYPTTTYPFLSLAQDHACIMIVLVKAVILKLELSSESPGGLLKTQIAGQHPLSF